MTSSPISTPPNGDRWIPGSSRRHALYTAGVALLGALGLRQAAARPGQSSSERHRNDDGHKHGKRGKRGDAGPSGAPGGPGSPGEKGEKGDSGAQGGQGEKGDQGNQGIEGIQGNQGNQGIQGQPGPAGSTITRVEGDPFTVQGPGAGSGVAVCPTGIAIGGGYTTDGFGPGCSVENSTLVAADTWFIDVSCFGIQTAAINMRVEVICLS